MKLQEYKDMFNLDTDEKFMAHCKLHQLGIYSCPHCGEIINDPSNYICCCKKGTD